MDSTPVVDTNRSIFLESAILAAAFTGFLYCASTAYTQGFFIHLGLDGDILDRNFHQILYDGFVKSLGLILSIITIFFIAVWVHSEAGREINKNIARDPLWVFNKKHKTKWFLSFFQYPNKQVSKYDLYYSKRLRTGIILFFITIIFFLAMVQAENKGKAATTKVKDSVLSNSHSMVDVKIDNKVHQLYPVFCGVRNCAAYNKDASKIFYFPQNGHVYTPATKARVSDSETANENDSDK